MSIEIIKTSDGEFQVEDGVLKKSIWHTTGRIHLPAGIKAVGNAAFYGDEDLSAVSCPDTLEEIGEEAFARCRSLWTVDLGKNTRKIGRGAFWDSALESIVFPDAVEEIGEQAFAYCNFKKIRIPASVTKIGWGAFERCRSLVKVRLPHNLQKLPDSIFCGCSSLQRIWLPDSVSEIGATSFAECSLRTLPLSASIRKLHDGAFRGNEHVLKVVIPKGITVIPAGCFAGLYSVKEVIIPDTVKRIEAGAFAVLGCPVFVPDSVEYIARNAFERKWGDGEVSIPKHLAGQLQLPENICIVRE